VPQAGTLAEEGKKETTEPEQETTLESYHKKPRPIEAATLKKRARTNSRLRMQIKAGERAGMTAAEHGVSANLLSTRNKY